MEAKSLILKYAKDYLLLIDEEAEIKENIWNRISIGTLFYSKIREEVVELQPKEIGYDPSGFEIIAYYPLIKESKELDLPLLPNPFKETDVETLATEYSSRYSQVVGRKYGFMDGFYTAQELQIDKQFSLEDMKKAFEAGANWQEGGTILYPDMHGFIQSLSTQRVPKEFIPEYEEYSFEEFKNIEENDITEKISNEYCRYSGGDESFEHWFYGNIKWITSLLNKRLKTKTNSEGKQEIVGIYKH